MFYIVQIDVLQAQLDTIFEKIDVETVSDVVNGPPPPQCLFNGSSVEEPQHTLKRHAHLWRLVLMLRAVRGKDSIKYADIVYDILHMYSHYVTKFSYINFFSVQCTCLIVVVTPESRSYWLKPSTSVGGSFFLLFSVCDLLLAHFIGCVCLVFMA